MGTVPNFNVHQSLAADWSTVEVCRIEPRDVHVWRARLNVAASVLQDLEASVSDDERRRAGRFTFERDRTRYIVRRGVLRTLLAQHLEVEPRRLVFLEGPYGKPALGPPFDDSGLSFNMSHSGDLALIALSSHREVGIDVEQIRPIPDAADLARRFFAPAEIAALERLPHEDRLAGFFMCWTRKEAYVKATGEGLNRPLDSFEIPVRPGEAPRLVSADPSADVDDWMMHDLVPAPEFIGAVAARGHQWSLRCGTWSAGTP